MRYNYSFGKLNEGIITYAPAVIHDGDIYNVAPSAADYAAYGYKPVVDTPPTTPAEEGYHWEARAWTEEDGKIVRLYVQVENPPPMPRTFSILRLETAIFQMGLTTAFDAFLDSQTVTNEHGQTVPLRRFYDRANDLREDHPLFAQYFAAAKTALGITDEQAEAILEAAEV